MTDVYTPTANDRLVVPVDETDVRFAARDGLKVGHRAISSTLKISACCPGLPGFFPTLGRLRYPRITALAFSAAAVIAAFADFAPETTSLTPIMKASWIGLDCG